MFACPDLLTYWLTDLLTLLTMQSPSTYLLSTHYVQSTCAVIGGVFTVFGMVVALLDTSSEVFSKKSI